MTKKYATNLKCQSCISTITPAMEGHARIESWSVDTSLPEKVLTVVGPASQDEVHSILQSSGFSVISAYDSNSAESGVANPQSGSTAFARWFATYRPLLLIVGYLIGIVLLSETLLGSFVWSRAMRHFMGGFFLAFSFFKFLDVAGFAKAFQGYDLLARYIPGYGVAYPFVELALGFAYLLNVAPVTTNLVTVVVMLAGLLGVTSVLRQGRKIQCACLGTVFNLPMSVVTFIENGTMVVMAIGMLVFALQ